MKLYTEEQVIEAMQQSRYAFTSDKGYDEIVKSLTPIELPSDEEIDEKSNFLFPIANRIGGSTYIAHKSFIEGAKWMKEQILNQNK